MEGHEPRVHPFHGATRGQPDHQIRLAPKLPIDDSSREEGGLVRVGRDDDFHEGYLALRRAKERIKLSAFVLDHRRAAAMSSDEARSTSATVVSRPSDSRIAPWASSSAMPIAVSTRDARVSPAWHA